MSDKNIEMIKHIQATGKCPEDAIMTTSMHSESGYQPKKVPIPPVKRADDLFIRHLQNQIEWFRSRMQEYRESFFKVCDIVEYSDAPDIIKKLVREEKDRY